ncbi:MAG: adenylosuccinate synthetase [Patescibacteria group bacterium]
MSRRAFLIAGIGYGDEGKGSIVDYLSFKHKPHTIIRFNGGSQAMHHVVKPDGTVHGFRQIGSGMFANPSVRTYLSKFMLVDPFFIHEEINELSVEKNIKYSFGQVIVDRECVVITPFHRLVGQMRELVRDDKRIGSCGCGVGEAMFDYNLVGDGVLLAGDLADKQKTLYKLRRLLISKIDIAEQLVDVEYSRRFTKRLLQEKLLELYDYRKWLDRLTQKYLDFFKFGFLKFGDEKKLKHILSKNGTVIFEGAQGALLDPRYGFAPYVTKTRMSFENANTLLDESGYNGDCTRIGVMRGYSTRHGPGPFITEDPRFNRRVSELHNVMNAWQGPFRIGWPDIVALKYGIDIVGGVDYLAVTSMDRIKDFNKIRVCEAYDTDLVSTNHILNKYFELHAGSKINRITRIKVLPEGKVGKGELTKLLKRCRPVYKNIYHHDCRYVDYLRHSLGVEVGIISHGPTRKDKIELIPAC